MPSQNYEDWKNDSSNFAQEGMGIFEYLQFLRKPKAEQDVERKRLEGSTTEVPYGKNNNNPHQ